MIAQVLSCVCVFPVVVFLAAALTLVALYMRRTYSYWESRGVPGPKPVWFIGNIYPRLRATQSMPEYDQVMYEKHGGKMYCGYYEFMNPCLMVGHPELLKHVMVKDFDHFTDRR